MALAVLAIGLATSRASALCSVAAALGLALAVGAVLMLPQNATLFHGMLVITPLTSLFKIICLSLAFFTVVLARTDLSSRNRGEYLALVLLATIGLMLLVGSEELLMIFIGLELTGLSLYVMAGFDKTDPRSAEAGLKYFLFGSTASAFTLFGLSFVYGRHANDRPRAIAAQFARGTDRAAAHGRRRMTLIGFAFVPPPRRSISGRRILLSGRALVPAACSSRPGRRSRRSSSWEKLSSSASVRCRAAPAGTRDCRLGAGPGRARGFVDRDWQSRRARSVQRSPAARLLRCRPRRLHLARTRRRRARDLLRRCSTPPSTHSRSSGLSASSRWCDAKPAATISPISPGCAGVRRCSPDAWRSSCFPWPACRRSPDFRKVLPLQRRDARRRKPRPALACRAGALRQSHLALLLPHRAQSDLRRGDLKGRLSDQT